MASIKVNPMKVNPTKMQNQGVDQISFRKDDSKD